MKYIAYVNDWFSLYINPVDYEGKADLFVQHIFQTLPFLEQLPKSAELNSLIEVIGVNGQTLIQTIEENNSNDAAAVFINLKSQIIRLKDLVKKYAHNHFNVICQDDTFVTKLQDYLGTMFKSLSLGEKKAIQESYLALKIEEMSLELTCQLAQKDHLEDLTTQTQIDKLSIEAEKLRFLGKVRAIILESKEGMGELKKQIESKLLTFCDYVDEQTIFKLKYDKRGMRQQVNHFLREQFSDLQILEKIGNDIKVEELSVQALITQEKLKHRSPENLEMIQQQLTNKKHKIATNRTLYENRKMSVDQAILTFYQKVLQSPIEEKCFDVIAAFQLEDHLILSPNESLLQQAVGLFKLVSATIEEFLPSQIDMQLGVLGAAAGAIMIGVGPLGLGAGLGVGVAAIRTNQTVTHIARESKEEWQACVDALYGKFTAAYKTPDYQANAGIKRTCDNDATKASIINAFYVRHLIKYDFEIASVQVDALQDTQLRKEKAQLAKHYQQLRSGQVKPKDFWVKYFKEDIALRVHAVQRLLKIHTNAYLICLFEQFDNQQESSQLYFHRDRLVGLMEELTELNLLANKNHWRKLREQNVVAYRSLLKTPLDVTYEEHVDSYIFHHSPLHLLFWLSEQAMHPKIKLAEPLTRFNGKTFWHLLAEREEGASFMQQMITAPVDVSSRTGAKILQKLWSVIASFKDNGIFDPTATYQGMNALAYAFKRGNIALLRVFLQDVLSHPQLIKEIGLNTLFDFVITAHPQIISLIDGLKPQGIAAFAKVLLFNQKADIQLGMMAALTMHVAKEGGLPQTKEKWQDFLSELKHQHSAYVQVKALKDYDGKQLGALSQHLLDACAPASLISTSKPPPQIKTPARVLLVNFQAPLPISHEPEKVSASISKKQIRKR